MLRVRSRLDALVVGSLIVAAGAVLCRYLGVRPAGCYDVAWTASAVGATVGTAAARRRAHPENRTRWTLWTAATASWLFGQLMWDLYGLIGFPGSPNPADVAWWGFALLITVSVVRIPRAGRAMLVVAAAETAPLICAAIALCVALLYGPYVHSAEPGLERISDLVYPCLYASASVLTLQSMLGGGLRAQRRRSLILFLAGTAIVSAAFMLWSVALLHGSYRPGHSVLDPLWVIGLEVIAAGGLMAAQSPEGAPPPAAPSHVRVLLPSGLFALMVAVLLGQVIAGASNASERILVLGILCSGAALMVRSTVLGWRLTELLALERSGRAKLAERETELARLNTQLTTLNEQLIEDSRHDALTGIGNRRALSDDLPMYRALQKERGESIAVLLCDIDHFKSYNDCFGHLTGDQALSTIAAVARGALRSGDAAYRFGGEELLLILRNSDTQTALAVAHRIRESVQRAALTHPLPTAGVLTVSVGVACGTDAPEDLLAAADAALYAAKEAGRNRVIASGDALVVDGAGRIRAEGAGDPLPRQLHSMLTISRAAASGVGAQAVAEALAEVIHSELSFGVVAVNLRETPARLRATVVHGDPSAREALLGTVSAMTEWDELVAVSRDIHGAAWLPAGTYLPMSESPTWRAQMVAPLSPEGWHPEDMLLLPIRGATRELLGFVSVDQPVLGRRPTDHEISVLMAVTDHAGLALEQARHHDSVGADESEALRLAAVMLLAEALDLRDPSTALHSRTVGGLARQTARELGYPDAQVERIYAAGVLHDLGKLGIPDAILHKPDTLDELEWQEMRRHPEVGARILEDAGMGDIAAWVRAHHERLDGAGYPLGLDRDTISPEARILSVADAYEAMIADRPYRAAMAASQARAELLAGAGSQFDADVVAAFLRALDATALDDDPAPASVAG